MPNFVYVDNSNVWIEGQRVSAVARRMAPDIWNAMEQRICDTAWSYDFGRLLEIAGGDKSEIGRAVLYGSRPPVNDSLWQRARNQGFEVKTFERNAVNKEKKIDTQIAVDITRDSYELMSGGDEITLVSGDADYVPVVELMIHRGFKFHVVFWEHAARELRGSASTFFSLNSQLKYIERKP